MSDELREAMASAGLDPDLETLADMYMLPSQRAAFDRIRARLSAAERDAAISAKASESLCRIYFDIAAECIGEDEVRRRRDTAIAATQEGKG